MRVRKWIWVFVLMAGLRFGNAVGFAEPAKLGGVYSMMGLKGAIVLTLKDDEKGGASGTLKGGGQSFELKGFAYKGEGGGVLGTAKSNGKFTSYFMARRQNGKIILDFLDSTPDGDPDLNSRKTFTFTPGASPAGGNAKQRRDAEDDADDEDTDAPDAAGDEDFGGAMGGAMDGEDVDEDEGGMESAFPGATNPESGAPGGMPDDMGEEQGGDEDEVGVPNAPNHRPEAAGRGAADRGAAGRVNYAGTFTGEGLTLTLKPAAGNDITGSINLGGRNFIVNGTIVNGVFHGNFKSGQDMFECTGRLEGNTLAFSSGDNQYRLTRKAAAASSNPLSKPGNVKSNPLAKPAAKPNPLGKAGGNNTRPPQGAKPAANKPAVKGGGGTAEPTRNRSAGWKIYRHATGLSMRYPTNWKLTQGEGSIQLTPPDAGSNQHGPTEFYFASAEGAEGVTSATDPRVVPYLDEQLQKLIPFMQRVGEPERINARGTTGIIVSWEGKNPRGDLLRAQAYTIILKGYAVSLIAIGEKASIAKRESTLREMLASFTAGAGKLDPQIAGVWSFWSYKSSADGKFGTETKRRLVLQPNGTCSWSGGSESSGNFSGKNSGGEQIWTGGVAGSSGNSDQGKWTVANGELYVLWNDGSTSTWGYRVSGARGNRRLFLKGSKPQADEWVEVQ